MQIIDLVSFKNVIERIVVSTFSFYLPQFHFICVVFLYLFRILTNNDGLSAFVAFFVFKQYHYKNKLYKNTNN